MCHNFPLLLLLNTSVEWIICGKRRKIFGETKGSLLLLISLAGYISDSGVVLKFGLKLSELAYRCNSEYSQRNLLICACGMFYNSASTATSGKQNLIAFKLKPSWK